MTVGDERVTWDDVVPHLVGLARLATANAAGDPAVAIVSAVIEDGVVWAMARRTSTKARNVAVRPAVALMWDGDGEAYVWGDATVVDGVDEKVARWSSWHYDAGAFFGAPEDDDVVMLRVRPRRATVLAAGPDGPVRKRWVNAPDGAGDPSRGR